MREWNGNIGAGESWVDRWVYTVPSGRMAMHAVIFGYIYGDIATSGRLAVLAWFTNIAAGGYKRYAEIVHYYGCGLISYFTLTATFMVKAGDIVIARTTSTDTIAHDCGVTALLTEFDA